MNTQMCQLTALKLMPKTTTKLSVKVATNNSMTGLLRLSKSSKTLNFIQFRDNLEGFDSFEQVIH